ncbi:MAG TPA: type 4a pilus biogenesis protein PilO [bacterium]|nr:type 4a pilus biogenesis protein PilO [bacterium]
MKIKGGKITIIMILFLCALIGLGYYLNIILIPELKNNQLRIEEKKTMLAAKQQELREVQELNTRFDEIKTEVDIALAALPSEEQITDILYQFSSIADELGLNTNNLSINEPASSSPKDKIKQVGITLSINGEYADLITYLSAIEKSLRLINIANVSVSGSSSLDDTDSLLTLSFQASAYYTPTSNK